MFRRWSPGPEKELGRLRRKPDPVIECKGKRFHSGSVSFEKSLFFSRVENQRAMVREKLLGTVRPVLATCPRRGGADPRQRGLTGGVYRQVRVPLQARRHPGSPGHLAGKGEVDPGGIKADTKQLVIIIIKSTLFRPVSLFYLGSASPRSTETKSSNAEKITKATPSNSK